GPDGVTRAPVFDITVLADLQEWVHAVDAFRVRSDAQRLVELLEKAHRRPWLARESGDSAVPRRLQKMAGCLRDFSRSLRLMRALDALEQAERARTLARQVEQEAAVWAKPFSHILTSVAAEVDSLAMDKPSDLEVEALTRQLALVKHYVAKDLIVQGVLLSREWLVNWLAWRCGEADWLDLQGRRRLECALSRAARRLRGQVEPEDETERTAERGPAPPDWFEALPEAQEAAELWDDLTSARNDIAHCGMNTGPKPAHALGETAKRLLGRMEGLLESSTSGA
ncbi:MAG: TM1812 family CRISPR-associated protein, partial [Bacillota bacterium]